MTAKRKYRTVGFWRDPKTDREIHGLKRRPDGRFYSSENPNKGFGANPSKAIKKFRKWEAQRANKTIPVLTPLNQILNTVERIKPFIDKPGADRFILDDSCLITGADEAMFWETVASLIHESPKLVAEKTGIEEIGYLDDLKPRRPGMRLSDVVTFYENKQQTSRKERQTGSKAWSDFLKTIRKVREAETVRDIKQAHINHFNGHIHKLVAIGKLRSVTAKHKLRMIKTILNFAIKKCDEDDKADLRRVRDLCESLDMPNGNGNCDDETKKTITPAEYQKLLKAARSVTLAGSSLEAELWECLLLISLNCCFGGKDLQDLKPKNIDLNKKTLVMRRSKNDWRGKNKSPVRVAVLWDRTVAAIRRYQRKRHHGLDTLFANCDYRKGGKFSKLYESTLCRQFAKLAKKAKVDATHKMLRSSGYTAAIDGGCDATHAEILMGHDVKISNVSDHYLERHPTMVAGACEAIEKVYFSQKKG